MLASLAGRQPRWCRLGHVSARPRPCAVRGPYRRAGGETAAVSSPVGELHRRLLDWLQSLPDRVSVGRGRTVTHFELRAVVHELVWSVRLRAGEDRVLCDLRGRGRPLSAARLAELSRVKRERVGWVLTWFDELGLTRLERQHGAEQVTVRTLDLGWRPPPLSSRGTMATVPGADGGAYAPLSPGGTATVPAPSSESSRNRKREEKRRPVR